MADEIKTGTIPAAESDRDEKKISTSSRIVDTVNTMIGQKFEANQFETKEEYIKHLLENQEGILKSSQKFSDNKIHLHGRLLIDNRVKSGLDWSDIISDSAVVIDGKINKAAHLPLTRRGIRSSLSYKDACEYMLHNACEVPFDGKTYQVDGVFRICGKNLPDLSTVNAERVLCYGDDPFELEKLPKARKGYFGVNDKLLIGGKGDNAKTAQEKGFSKAICKSFKAGIFKKLRESLPQKKNSNTAG